MKMNYHAIICSEIEEWTCQRHYFELNGQYFEVVTSGEKNDNEFVETFVHTKEELNEKILRYLNEVMAFYTKDNICEFETKEKFSENSYYIFFEDQREGEYLYLYFENFDMIEEESDLMTLLKMMTKEGKYATEVNKNVIN